MPNDGLSCVCGQSAVKPCIRWEQLSTTRRLHMWIRMTMWLSCWQSHLSGPKASQVCSNDFAAYIPCKRGVWTVRRRGLSRSCRPQELEPLPLTSVWVMWELELWASVTPIFVFFQLVVDWANRCGILLSWSRIGLRGVFWCCVTSLCYQCVTRWNTGTVTPVSVGFKRTKWEGYKRER